jgi:hypothetical protein
VRIVDFKERDVSFVSEKVAGVGMENYCRRSFSHLQSMEDFEKKRFIEMLEKTETINSFASIGMRDPFNSETVEEASTQITKIHYHDIDPPHPATVFIPSQQLLKTMILAVI